MTNGTQNLADTPTRPLTNDILFWVGLFVAMLLGMIAKALHDNLIGGVRMDTLLEKEVIIPVLVSPIIFGGIYGIMRETPRNIGTFIFAFQNGFFWKAIFSQTTQSPQ